MEKWASTALGFLIGAAIAWLTMRKEQKRLSEALGRFADMDMRYPVDERKLCHNILNARHALRRGNDGTDGGWK